MWTCFEGLDPHIKNLNPSQFSSLDMFYSFFDQFLSENYALDQIPKITDEFKSTFLSHYRSFLQMRSFAKVASNWAAPAPKPAQLTEQAPAAGSIRLFPPCALSQPLTTTITSPPPLPPNKPVDPQVPWMIIGSTKKTHNKPRSFAAAVAGSPQLSHNPLPITITDQIRDLTDAQLQSLLHDRLIEAYKVCFNCWVMSRSASKVALIAAYKRDLAKLPSVSIPATNPPKANPTHPHARPLVTTEFTVTHALQGPQRDAAAIVCSLQTSICQAYTGSNPSMTLLSGRWSSQLSLNFVLTFAGQPSIDKIFRLCRTLLSPFQPRASLVPQCGFTRIILHSVPVVRTNGVIPSSEELMAELGVNPVCQNLRIISPPKWICTSIEPEKHHSSVLFSIIDESGAVLAWILQDPPFLYGAQSVAEWFNSLLLACQCDRCHHLRHAVKRCQFSKSSIICPLCGGPHAAKDHT